MLLAEKLNLLTDLENSFKLQLKKVQSEKKQLAKKQAKIEKLYQLQYELTTDPDTADTIGGGCQVHQLTPIVIEIFDADEAIALPSIAVPEVIEQPTDEMPSDPDEAIAQTTDQPDAVTEAVVIPTNEPETNADVVIAEPEIITEQPTDEAIAEPEQETKSETEATVTQPIESEVAPQENEPPTEKTEDAIAEVVPDADTTPQPATVNPELEAMSIRQLKALAAAAKIKNYGKMSKQQLVEALS